MVTAAVSHTSQAPTPQAPLFLALELGAKTWTLGFTTCQMDTSFDLERFPVVYTTHTHNGQTILLHFAA
jgi:hypothetical protein